MAQRNPMNERYQGEGQQGKTRKSAAKLKPKTEAASTVHIEAKPTTKQERKAAQKRRKAQLEAKERERLRKAKERERKEREAAGELIEEPKPPTMLDKVKGIFINTDKEPTASASSGEETEKKSEKGDGRGAKASTAKDDQLLLQTTPTWQRGPDTPEYRRLKYIYWAMLGGGLGAAALSLVLNYTLPVEMQSMAWNFPLVIAYAAIIGALILDTTKIKKIQRAHASQGSGRKSPKQVKHAKQQAEAAALIEQSKKAQKEQKRANSKIPFVKTRTKIESDSKDAEKEVESDAEETTKEAKDEQ